MEYNVNFTISNCQSPEIYKASRFIERLLKQPIPDEQWYWLNSFNKDSEFIITAYNSQTNELVAANTLVAIEVVIFGKLFLMGRVDYTYLDVPYRGTNVYPLLYKRMIDNAIRNKLVLIISYSSSYLLWKKRFGYFADAHAISKAGIRLNVSPKLLTDKTLPFPKKQIKIFLQRASSMINRLLLIRHAFGVSKYFINYNVFPLNDFNLLYSKVLKTEEIVYIPLKEDFFKWRVLSNPYFQYQSICVYDADNLVGYIIFSLNRNHLNISEMLYTSNSVFNCLLYESFKIALNDKVEVVQFFGNNKFPFISGTFRNFKRNGGRVFKSNIKPFLFKNLIPFDNIDDLSRWYINGFWTEGYEI